MKNNITIGSSSLSRGLRDLPKDKNAQEYSNYLTLSLYIKDGGGYIVLLIIFNMFRSIYPSNPISSYEKGDILYHNYNKVIVNTI